MKRTNFVVVIAFIALLLWPVAAFACACCSEPGHYHSGVVDLDDHPRSELKRLRAARTASLYETAAGLDEDALGIAQPKSSYSIQSAFVGNVWRFTFRSGTSSGTLELPLPNKIWSHSADIHDGKLSPGGGPSLYKEWRLEGDVKGTGIFKDGTAQAAKYVLVLQGRGNACDNAEDFGYWRLEVSGEKVRFAFHGKLTWSARARN
ncbi:MAG TPA: hypothetical protein VM941_04160 [Pyrinomonadaceae bacterium]|jgi:hypothetical protein|nr:hypothetical protein [Pyrinomonadaceae bacterium]